MLPKQGINNINTKNISFVLLSLKSERIISMMAKSINANGIKPKIKTTIAISATPSPVIISILIIYSFANLLSPHGVIQAFFCQ
jgi:hypothetical protein